MPRIGYNPLQLVGATSVPAPSSYKWGMQDVSKSTAGRTLDGTMDKARIGQVEYLDLEWRYPSFANAAIILQAFQPEYINITYLSPLTGTLVTKNFYVGDRSGVLYNTEIGRWESISFRITCRYASAVTENASSGNESGTPGGGSTNVGENQ